MSEIDLESNSDSSGEHELDLFIENLLNHIIFDSPEEREIYREMLYLTLDD